MKFRRVSINVQEPEYSSIDAVVEAADLKEYVAQTYFKEGVDIDEDDLNEIVDSFTFGGDKYYSFGEDEQTILFLS